ncbi:MAG: primosomal protein N' [Gammaproteobacteria bacterium]
MSLSQVVQIALLRNFHKILDYLPLQNTKIPSDYEEGSRVLVPLKNQADQVGIVVNNQHKSSLEKSKLKSVLACLDSSSFFKDHLRSLLAWLSAYYAYPLGACYEAALPSLLRKPQTEADILASTRKKKPKLNPKLLQTDPEILKPTKILQLNLEQDAVIQSIISHLGEYKAFLLYGITGSGKTEVYMRCIEAVLKRGEQVLVLVPEIGLTPQLLERFQSRFSEKMAVLHSRLGPKTRYANWCLAKSGEAKIVLGTRSAVFTPLLKPGLFIIDEEHDLSFKQQDNFRYHGKDTLIMRAHLEKCPIVLGTATPSLESFYNAKITGKYQWLSLNQRANQSALPEVKILDTRHKKLKGGLSSQLLEAISQTLAREEQVILFLNQRGFSPLMYCLDCQYKAQCKACDAKLTYHKKKNVLICHHCDSSIPYSEICVNCGSANFKPVGQGTEKLEAVLQKKFPEIPVSRVDRDTVNHPKKIEELMHILLEGKPHLLIGTQMLAKGHHFPKVTLVGIVDIDSAFFNQDFRALERVAQLITQVAGRAGRENLPSQVFIQSKEPQNKALHLLLGQGYLPLAEALLKEREELGLPPYSHQVLIKTEAKRQAQAISELYKIREFIVRNFDPGFQAEVWGPMASNMAKKKNKFRAQLLLQTRTRQARSMILKRLGDENFLKSTFIIDVDPLEMG